MATIIGLVVFAICGFYLGLRNRPSKHPHSIYYRTKGQRE